MTPLPLTTIKYDLSSFFHAVATFAWNKARITEVHWHHTYHPNHDAFWSRGGEQIVREIFEFHTRIRGWRHMGQHVTIDPEGFVWQGRPWNLKPASATGFNGEDNGPHAFMFEMIGDFRRGHDALTGAQLDAALLVTAIVQKRFSLRPNQLRFHNEMQPTECPGHIKKAAIIDAVASMHNVISDNQIAPEETYAPLQSGESFDRDTQFQSPF